MFGSVSSLQSEIGRRRGDADSKYKLAESLRLSAENHEKSGNTTQAQIDLQSAERYEQEAQDAEKQAGIYEAEALIRMQRAAHIDKELEQLDRQYKHDRAALEEKKHSLLG